MSSSKPLDGYLNDHLAGSTVALELIGKLRSNNEETAFGTFLAELDDEIQADRATLEQVMESLGVSRGAIRQA